MKTHTTNYTNTFIMVAVDTTAFHGEIPKTKGEAITIAKMQYDILKNNPYKFTSDEVLLQIFAERNQLTDIDLAIEIFFSKGQPCFRTSALAKTYGWGIHFNDDAKVAIYGMETKEYDDFLNNKNINKVKAIQSKRS
jgi:hypothetical protein